MKQALKQVFLWSVALLGVMWLLPLSASTSASTQTAVAKTAPNTSDETSASAPTPLQWGTELKVVSWNIQLGRGTDGRTDIYRTADSLARLNPDLIGLTEVQAYLGQDEDLRNLLTQMTGVTWYSHYVPGCPTICGGGNQILSKYPFVSTDRLYFTYGVGQGDPSVAQATINVNGRRVAFFTTHLDAETAWVRWEQGVELVNWLVTGGFPETYIVAGDFNTYYGASPAQIQALDPIFHDAWRVAVAQGLQSSYPDNPDGRTRRARIDYVFYTMYDPRLVLTRAQVPDSRDFYSPYPVVQFLGNPDDYGVRPSDHNQVVATFQVW